jgi:hypothetical protein
MSTGNPFDFSDPPEPPTRSGPPPLPPRRPKRSQGGSNKKLIYILAGVAGGVVLLCCGGIGLVAVFGGKRSCDGLFGASGGKTETGVKGVVIKLEPYTTVEMPQVAAERTHTIEAGGKSRFKTYNPTKPVPVKDIAKVDFTQGPNGEPIQMAKYVQGKSLSQQGYFYLNKAGEMVYHGPWKQFSGDGKQQVVLEDLYIHGVQKAEYMSYDKPSQVDEYRGDDDHKRVETEYYENGSRKEVRRYKVIHKAGPDGETESQVLHGLSERYYDNTLVERTGQVEHVGGVMKQEIFEYGVSMSFAVYDRSGKLVTSSGPTK